MKRLNREEILNLLAKMEFVVTGRGTELILFEKNGFYFDLSLNSCEVTVDSTRRGICKLNFETVAGLKKFLKQY